MFSRRIIQRLSVISRPHAIMKMAVPQRTFSSFESIEKAAQKLQKSLDSEIKYENENYTQLEDIETFLNESGFKFMEQENGLNMSLTKEVGDKHVEVQFEAR
mgnify:CR=1 FL=1